MTNERQGRLVFYGAMIIEGLLALIWTTIGLSFYDSPEALQTVVSAGSPSAVVAEVSNTLLGPLFGSLSILAVIVLPVTSGDTAFRATRLIVAETFKVKQQAISKRLLVAVPLFILGFLIATQDFSLIWRYFGFANQSLATLVLWSGAAYLGKQGKQAWVAAVPATFMTAVCCTFLLNAGIGFNLGYGFSVAAGAILSLLALALFVLRFHRGGKPAREPS